jgi:hypothetical protein
MNKINKTKRSIGQGNIRSRLNLCPAGLSVVQRLATRSVTGRGPNINVHQNSAGAYIWNGLTERRCFGRFFETFDAIEKFC